jgi:hypothetical protein
LKSEIPAKREVKVRLVQYLIFIEALNLFLGS